MKLRDNFIFLILNLLFFSFAAKQSFSQNKEDETRAEWIFNLSYGITWENEDHISSFTIGVFSSQSLYDELLKLAQTKTIKRKAVIVIRYTKVEDIQANQIIYVSKNENANLSSVYKKVKNKNVLIISDRSKQPDYSIINFNKTDNKNPKPFSINAKLADENHIKFSKQMLKIGGTRETIQKIYAETNRKFLAEQKALEEKKKETDSLKQRILFLEKENKKLQDRINQNSEK